MARILLIDDDPDIVESMQLILQAEGHEVETASNRRDGLHALDRPFDLLIVDVMMEEADDGLVLVREIRRRGERMPILMLTAIGRVTCMTYSRDDDLLPVDAFLEKPVSPETLVTKVRGLLDA